MQSIYHAREQITRARTSCGERGTSADTLAEWIRAELCDVGVWTEPELGREICSRCLARITIDSRRVRADKPLD